MTFLGKVSPAGASRSPDWWGRGGRHLAILWEKPRSHKAWAAALTLAPSSLRPQMRPLTSLNTPLVISEMELSSIYPARVKCRGLLWAWEPQHPAYFQALAEGAPPQMWEEGREQGGNLPIRGIKFQASLLGKYAPSPPSAQPAVPVWEPGPVKAGVRRSLLS